MLHDLRLVEYVHAEPWILGADCRVILRFSTAPGSVPPTTVFKGQLYVVENTTFMSSRELITTYKN